MAKKSELQMAIEHTEQEIAMLQRTLDKMRAFQRQKATTPRKPRGKKESPLLEAVK